MAGPVVTGKGGLSVSALVKLLRRTEAYEMWKRAVFVRDRFTCQQCGRRNGRERVIEAHHLVEFSTLVRNHQLCNVDAALSCPSLWSIDNGQTLCHTCHQQTDSYPKNFVDKKKRNGKRKATHRRAKTADC